MPKEWLNWRYNHLLPSASCQRRSKDKGLGTGGHSEARREGRSGSIFLSSTHPPSPCLHFRCGYWTLENCVSLSLWPFQCHSIILHPGRVPCALHVHLADVLYCYSVIVVWAAWSLGATTVWRQLCCSCWVCQCFPSHHSVQYLHSSSSASFRIAPRIHCYGTKVASAHLVVVFISTEQ